VTPSCLKKCLNGIKRVQLAGVINLSPHRISTAREERLLAKREERIRDQMSSRRKKGGGRGRRGGGGGGGAVNSILYISARSRFNFEKHCESG